MTHAKLENFCTLVKPTPLVIILAKITSDLNSLLLLHFLFADNLGTREFMNSVKTSPLSKDNNCFELLFFFIFLVISTPHNVILYRSN